MSELNLTLTAKPFTVLTRVKWAQNATILHYTTKVRNAPPPVFVVWKLDRRWRFRGTERQRPDGEKNRLTLSCSRSAPLWSFLVSNFETKRRRDHENRRTEAKRVTFSIDPQKRRWKIGNRRTWTLISTNDTYLSSEEACSQWRLTQ